MNYAVIDLGSNTIRLSVYQAEADGRFSLLFSEKETAGIAGYIRQNALSPEGVDRAADALSHFQELLRRLKLESTLHVFATASLRNIRNTQEAVETIHRKTGLHVSVLSGEEESLLGYYGAMPAWGRQNGVIFDIGGGSTEILSLQNGAVQTVQSIPLGSLNLFRQYVSKLWPKREEIRSMQEQLNRSFQGVLPQKSDFACGVGGTARAVLKIANAHYGRQGRTLTVEEWEETAAMLLQRDKTARKFILQLCPDRVHTILPGVLLLEFLCRHLCRKELFISPNGVREGYLCRKLLTP